VIPAYLVSKSARRQSKVLLSGMGADEVFGGYRRQQVESLISWYVGLPRPTRRALKWLVMSSPARRGSRAATAIRYAKKLMSVADAPAARRYVEASSWLDSGSRRPLYSDHVRWSLDGAEVGARHLARLAEVSDADAVTQSLYLDTLVYLPGHNLAYTDKTSMAASVEVRVPFLDNDLVDYAFTLPARMKIKRFRRKHILRKALEGIVPREILTRPKTGFAAPIRSWLHQDLAEMTRDLLSPGRIAARGLFSATAVSAMLDEEMSGRTDRSYNVWSLLTLELWLQHAVEGARAVIA
jgi:asparagine synthase (glutamine-hydrolysing)